MAPSRIKVQNSWQAEKLADKIKNVSFEELAQVDVPAYIQGFGGSIV